MAQSAQRQASLREAEQPRHRARVLLQQGSRKGRRGARGQGCQILLRPADGQIQGRAIDGGMLRGSRRDHIGAGSVPEDQAQELKTSNSPRFVGG